MQTYPKVALARDWSKSLGDKILFLYRNKSSNAIHGVFLDSPEESIGFIEKQAVREVVDILYPEVKWKKNVISAADLVNHRDKPGRWVVSYLDPRTTSPLVFVADIEFSKISKHEGKSTPNEFMAALSSKNSSIVNVYPPRYLKEEHASVITFLQMLVSIRTHLVYAPDMEQCAKLYEKAKREGIKQLGWTKKKVKDPEPVRISTEYTQLLEEIFQKS